MRQKVPSIAFLSFVLLLGSFSPFVINSVPTAYAAEPFDPVPVRIATPHAVSDYDNFGYAVSTNGNEIVIGAPSLKSSAAFGPGSAFLFDDSGTLISELLKPSPLSGEVFGKSVSIDGSHALVGATGVSGGVGEAYDYTLRGTLSTAYKNPSPGGVDIFGEEVDVLRDFVLIGVPLDDSLAFDSGIAYLIQRSTGSITTIGNPSPAGGDVFGASLALGPDFAVIAAESHDGVAPHIGEVYIFDYSGRTPLVTIPNPSPIIYDSFGVDVAIDGTDVLISAPAGDGRSTQPGTVYLYDSSGTLNLPIPNPDPDALDRFGHSIDMNGDLIVIGAPHDDFGASNAGSVYVFDKTGTLLQTIHNPTPDADDQFGFSVSLFGNLLVVGAPTDDTLSTDSGIAYLYTLSSPGPVDSDGDGV
ncbi:FG-GAP repeat protein, partial [Nitrosopumilus sp. S6]